MSKLFYKIVGMIVLFLVLSCGESKKPTTNLRNLPSYETELFKLYSYDKQARTKTIITGKKSIVFRNSREIWIDSPRILYSSSEDGKIVEIELKAKKGKVYYDSLNCEAWGSAVLIRKGEIRIETERIFWDQKKEKVYTQDEEKVILFKRTDPETEKESVIRIEGRNLLANLTMETVELEESTSEVPKFLFEDEEDKQGTESENAKKNTTSFKQ